MIRVARLQRYEWTHGPSANNINAYGADSSRFLLGFFGPRDNTLFARE